MLSLSTGLQMALVGNAGFSMAMGGGLIRIYSGPRPASADLPVPPTALELARITTMGRTFYPGNDTEGAGLFFRILPPGIVENDGRWGIVGIRAGQAAWFRWNWWNVDGNTESYSIPRIDGDVVVAGEIGDLYLPSRTMAVGTSYFIDTFVASFGNI
jgi:hypothetical protein